MIEHFIDDIQLVTEEEYNAYWVVTEDYKGAEFLKNEPIFWENDKKTRQFPIKEEVFLGLRARNKEATLFK